MNYISDAFVFCVSFNFDLDSLYLNGVLTWYCSNKQIVKTHIGLHDSKKMEMIPKHLETLCGKTMEYIYNIHLTCSPILDLWHYFIYSHDSPRALFAFQSQKILHLVEIFSTLFSKFSTFSTHPESNIYSFHLYRNKLLIFDLKTFCNSW